MGMRPRVVVIVAALSTALVAADLGAQSPGKVARIGFLHPGTPPNTNVDVFRRTLREIGYLEGQNIAIEFRWADGQIDRLPRLAAELVDLKADVIVVGSAPAIKAVARATRTIPIVMTVVADPVADGLVKSLAKPGGNITGLTLISPELSGKRIELLKEAMPRLVRLAVLWNPNTPAHVGTLRDCEATGRTLGLQILAVEARRVADLEPALATAARERAAALFVLDDTFLFIERQRITELGLRHRLPLLSGISGYADVGALLTYGASQAELHRRAALIVDRILKGARPATLPIEQPSSFELVLNLKTAKAFGLVIPESLLLRADRLIE